MAVLVGAAVGLSGPDMVYAEESGEANNDGTITWTLSDDGVVTLSGSGEITWHWKNYFQFFHGLGDISWEDVKAKLGREAQVTWKIWDPQTGAVSEGNNGQSSGGSSAGNGGTTGGSGDKNPGNGGTTGGGADKTPAETGMFPQSLTPFPRLPLWNCRRPLKWETASCPSCGSRCFSDVSLGTRLLAGCTEEGIVDKS